MTFSEETSVAHVIETARQPYSQATIRTRFGEALTALGGERTDFIVLTSDLMYATGIERFGALYPDRLFNIGIAEQNMAGVAAGLALNGKLPIVCGYAAFTTLRAIEQVKVDLAYNGVKVILTAQSAGLSYGVGGPTHQTFEDVAIMRAIPNTVVLVPSDANEVEACLRAALDYEVTGPIYIRLGRGPEYVYSPSGQQFCIGKPILLKEGQDICLIANGAMVFEALLASNCLRTLGITASVLNVHTAKPMDEFAVRAAISGCRAVVVVEEHSVRGGLGGAVLEVLAEGGHPPLRILGVADFFPPIGPTHELRAFLGLDATNIVHTAIQMLGGRSA